MLELTANLIVAAFKIKNNLGYHSFKYCDSDHQLDTCLYGWACTFGIIMTFFTKDCWKVQEQCELVYRIVQEICRHDISREEPVE